MNKNSRYTLGGVTEVSPGFYEWWERQIYQKDPSDIVYIMEKKYENRPDLLAHLFYEDSKLWWLICQYNNILDVANELIMGKLLYIPDINRIRTFEKSLNLQKFIPSKRIL
jgi:hypothetical protein